MSKSSREIKKDEIRVETLKFSHGVVVSNLDDSSLSEMERAEARLEGIRDVNGKKLKETVVDEAFDEFRGEGSKELRWLKRQDGS